MKENFCVSSNREPPNPQKPSERDSEHHMGSPRGQVISWRVPPGWRDTEEDPGILTNSKAGWIETPWMIDVRFPDCGESWICHFVSRKWLHFTYLEAISPLYKQSEQWLTSICSFPSEGFEELHSFACLLRWEGASTGLVAVILSQEFLISSPQIPRDLWPSKVKRFLLYKLLIEI